MHHYRRLTNQEEEILNYFYEKKGTIEQFNIHEFSVDEFTDLDINRDMLFVMAQETGTLAIIDFDSGIFKITEQGIAAVKILRNKQHRANIFKKMTSEDYLLAVHYLSKNKPLEMVSMSDLAEELGLTNSAISEYIKTMQLDGTLQVVPRKGVRLTPKGIEIAENLLKKREILFNFFHNILKVDRNLADIEAHVLEHNISSIITNRIKLLSAQLETNYFDLKIPDKTNK